MTVDEIRARNSAADWSQQQAQDIRYLLGENERLTQLNEARKQLLVAYRTANPKLAERALTKIERLERIITPQPNNAIPTQSGRNSDAIAAEKE